MEVDEALKAALMPFNIQNKINLWLQINNSKRFGDNSNYFAHTEDRVTQ